MLKNNKSGLSELIATVLLIALTIAIAGVVWVIVNNFIRDRTNDTSNCMELYEKVNLNSRYTCYDSAAKELQISISVGNVDVDSILVGVSGKSGGVTFKLTKTLSAVANVYTYPDHINSVKVPQANAGLTYYFNTTAAGLSEAPKLIQVSPVIKGTQCDVSDMITEIYDCSTFVP